MGLGKLYIWQWQKVTDLGLYKQNMPYLPINKSEL